CLFVLLTRCPPRSTLFPYTTLFRSLQAATAALAAAGYRASRENHHYRVIQSLELTLGKDAKFIRAFDAFRKKRNVSSYEGADERSEEHTSELQSRSDLVCRLLLEKK